jgi:uncharacterized damage-inducible protein DinB
MEPMDHDNSTFEPPTGLAPFYDGWALHQADFVRVLAPLTAEDLALRPSPDMWAIWQLASNIVGGRAYWFNDILGEGPAATRDMFRMTTTTVPDLALSDAGWEDDDNHPRTAAELVDAFEKTWAVITDCLGRWSAEDLVAKLETKRGTQTRGWVIWHVIEHELEHGAEIAVLLRQAGLPTIEL